MNQPLIRERVLILLILSLAPSAGASEPICFEVQSQIERVQFLLEVFARLEGRYPATLEELVQHEAVDWWHAELQDRWGQYLSYRRRGEGYELYSNGPDRIPMTYDDIIADVGPGTCKEPWGCSAGFVGCGL